MAFAGTLGLSYCSRAPEMMFYAGRPAAKGPAADGLVSGPEDSADDMIARFSDAGFSADELVALLASHSVAAASTLDAAILGAPLDTTPQKFDTRFFNEVRRQLYDPRRYSLMRSRHCQKESYGRERRIITEK